jgi:hypothetical protein
MKAKYRLFRRGKIFYAENANTGKQESLHTSDTLEAKRLIAAKNEAVIFHAKESLPASHFSDTM